MEKSEAGKICENEDPFLAFFAISFNPLIPSIKHVYSPLKYFVCSRVGRICIDVNLTDPWWPFPVFSCPVLLKN